MFTNRVNPRNPLQQNWRHAVCLSGQTNDRVYISCPVSASRKFAFISSRSECPLQLWASFPRLYVALLSPLIQKGIGRAWLYGDVITLLRHWKSGPLTQTLPRFLCGLKGRVKQRSPHPHASRHLWKHTKPTEGKSLLVTKASDDWTVSYLWEAACFPSLPYHPQIPALIFLSFVYSILSIVPFYGPVLRVPFFSLDLVAHFSACPSGG